MFKALLLHHSYLLWWGKTDSSHFRKMHVLLAIVINIYCKQFGDTRNWGRKRFLLQVWKRRKWQYRHWAALHAVIRRQWVSWTNHVSIWEEVSARATACHTRVLENETCFWCVQRTCVLLHCDVNLCVGFLESPVPVKSERVYIIWISSIHKCLLVF